MWEFFPDKGPKLLNLFRSSGGFFFRASKFRAPQLIKDKENSFLCAAPNFQVT